MPGVILAGARRCAAYIAAALVLGVAASPAASAQQSLNVSIGGFSPRGEDGRTPNDVLVNDLTQLPLIFQISDFHSVVIGADYLIGFGNNFEVGLGGGYTQRSVPSVYADLVNSDGSEIEQTLRLRIIPFSATVRFLPLGRHSTVVPYIGAGVGIFAFHYSESGQWVDPSDNSIFRESYTGSGGATGPLIVGGIRVPLGSFAPGFELRYQSAVGDLPADQFTTSASNQPPKIDLGGFTYLFSLNFRF